MKLLRLNGPVVTHNIIDDVSGVLHPVRYCYFFVLCVPVCVGNAAAATRPHSSHALRPLTLTPPPLSQTHNPHTNNKNYKKHKQITTVPPDAAARAARQRQVDLFKGALARPRRRRLAQSVRRRALQRRRRRGQALRAQAQRRVRDAARPPPAAADGRAGWFVGVLLLFRGACGGVKVSFSAARFNP